MATAEHWVSVDEVCTHLDVGKDTIYRWVETKNFPAHKAGRLLRFRLSEVDEEKKSKNNVLRKSSRKLGQVANSGRVSK